MVLLALCSYCGRGYLTICGDQSNKLERGDRLAGAWLFPLCKGSSGDILEQSFPLMPEDCPVAPLPALGESTFTGKKLWVQVSDPSTGVSANRFKVHCVPEIWGQDTMHQGTPRSQVSVCSKYGGQRTEPWRGKSVFFLGAVRFRRRD